MLQQGLVSVIMSNYNTPEEYLRMAIDSVLCQTYSSFEFIIVDDGSTNNSKEIINSYNDSRIILIENRENIGLTKSLNIALKQAKGEFVARMDADDYCEPDRFKKQIDYLSSHPDCIVCGTRAGFIGDYKRFVSINETGSIIPENNEEYKIFLLFDNYPSIIHISAMFNNFLLKKENIWYDEKYIYAQDYRMWVSCSQNNKCHALSECLMKIRLRNGTISTSKKDIQDDCARRIMEEQLAWINLSLPNNWETIHKGFFVGRKEYDLSQRKWIKTIIGANRKHKIYQQSLLKKMLWKKWAETTYFKLYQSSTTEKIQVLFRLPFKYWKELIKIKQLRSKKENPNGRF